MKIPPASKFPVPQLNPTPLLDFRCTQAIRPFTSPDDDHLAHFLIDTRVGFDVGQPLVPPSIGSYAAVTVKTEGVGILTGGRVTIGSSGQLLPIPLSLLLKPRLEPYNISCTATLINGQSYHTSTLLHYLPPNPTGGSVVKMDAKTRGLLVKANHASVFTPIVPFGFYTSFSNYLATNLSVLDEIKANGHVYHCFSGYKR